MTDGSASGDDLDPTASPRAAGPRHRQVLSARLRRVAPVLGDIYLEACHHLDRPSSAARMTMLAHAVRELIGELAAHLARDSGTPLPDRVDVDGAIQLLVDTWERAGLTVNPASAEADRVGDDSLRAVPSAVYDSANDLVAAHHRVSENAGRARALVASSTADARSPSTRRLREIVDLLSRHYHLSRTRPAPAIDEETLRTAFHDFELIVNARLAPFFDVLAELQDVITEANAMTGDSSEEGAT